MKNINWNFFFKPTISKIILSIIIVSVVSIFLPFIGVCGVYGRPPAPGNVCDPRYVSIPAYFISYFTTNIEIIFGSLLFNFVISYMISCLIIVGINQLKK